MGKRWGRTSGANIPNVRVYVCESCQTWNGAKKPAQCKACGHMNFIHFPSKAEARRYGELMLEQSRGLISDLKLQSRFPLHAAWQPPDGYQMQLHKIGEYRADFEYTRDGQRVIEDVKGAMDTPLSAWKRKHAEAEHGVTIQVVRR
ncbi:MAG: DUF1064 domain-containing protein [Rhodospirillaceae bacterium]|nr:DUF1064 domain-containing protein [Rhodospirillaceae bacterium]